jgi:hypothetical protein
MNRSRATNTAAALLALAGLAGASGRAAAEELTAVPAVEESVKRGEVFVGDSFLFQIQIQGHDAPETPDVSGIQDFDVESLGGRQNSSSSVTIVNGRMAKRESLGYLFTYRLTPRRAGPLTIPAIAVRAGGRTAATDPVPIRASVPAESEDFKLRLQLSDETCYVGQPVTLTVAWYIGKDVEGFQFHLPVLSDGRFDATDAEVAVDPMQRDRYLRVPVGAKDVIGEKGRETLQGKEYLTIRFRKILIPRKAGRAPLPRATVSCNAVVGLQGRRAGPMDDAFDDFFFGRRKQAVTRKFVTPSNEPVLNVLDLPASDRPAGFSGLVGRYAIHASAAPTEVRVGDPITLTVRVSGPDYLENVKLPALDRQPALAKDFKIPAEMAAAKGEGKAKVFTQTIRARHADVKAVPPIELPYFDAAAGRYAVARSEPIPLAVSPTRVVTAQDAEGREAAAPKSEVETWAQGIAHNYEDLSVLSAQLAGPAAWLERPAWWVLLGLPPLLYFTLLGAAAAVRRRRADPAAREARQAFGLFARAIRDLREAPAGDPREIPALALEALRQYLGRKLRLPPGALTYGDVRRPLQDRRVGEGRLEALRRIFETCEASRYAGVADRGATPALLDEMLDVAKQLEEALA